MNPRGLAESVAALATRWIGLHAGERFPFTYVSEYPKSGGTWLARMVGDYLQIPFPQYSLLPITFESVIQNHWRADRRLRRVLYLYRDGRDVLTSLYYQRFRVLTHSDRPGRDRVGRRLERLFGRDFDASEIVSNMPRFLDYEFRHPGLGARVNWKDHVEEWLALEGSPDVVFLTYEDLRADCAAALRRALEDLLDEEIDPWRLETTVEKMSMRRQAGREPGEADPTQHLRKGVVGDWRNAFNREAAEVFDHLAGDLLVRLGYEEDRRWVDRYELPS
ncbi:MAG: hypothetical protein DWQ36_18435 [Acidobacteria bacterium]|nr:MAG: hypothetical protein DWQ30_13215 [Acidobacteriota bacterium]REK04405.1 MAG: hypothetical protein DWQ36_18435 [Acidobacteriota bacterium]